MMAFKKLLLLFFTMILLAGIASATELNVEFTGGAAAASFYNGIEYGQIFKLSSSGIIDFVSIETYVFAGTATVWVEIWNASAVNIPGPVSYTHLTLPTILLV